MKDTKDYKFKFSIVTAVYNVEPYLDKMINSIINQNIGFKENVQLILVDDGSTDNSGKICDKWASLYPNNIMIIHKQNGGVSSARNEGLKYVEGKYVNFCDSDDMLTTNTLKKVYSFFEKNLDVDVAKIKVRLFGAVNQEYWQNTNFDKKDKIIDLNTEFDVTDMSVSYSFIRATRIDIINFNEHMSHAEDIDVINKILLENPKLGLVSSCYYNYRKYNTTNSLSSSANKKLSYFTTDFDVLTKDLKDYSLNKFNCFPKFLQYVIASDLRWYLSKNTGINTYFNADEITKFYKTLFDFLATLDEDVILKLKNYTSEYKVSILKLKYKNMYNTVKYANHMLSRLKKKIDKANWVVDNYSIEKDRANIYCHINILFYCEKEKFLFLNNDKVINNVKILSVQTINFYDCLESYTTIYIKIETENLDKLNLIKGVLNIDDVSVPLRLCASKNSPFNTEIKNSYFATDNYISFIKYNKIFIKTKKFGDIFRNEIKYEYSILKSKIQLNKFKILACRWLYFLLLPFMKNKNIWLFSDKADKADDNAEALFKYTQNKKNKKQHNYFLINKKYPDFRRMKKYGKVVNYMSKKHIILYMFSKYKISAHSHKEFRNPFMVYECFFRDISAKSKFIFLQHGITIGDVSNILNKYNINASLFITAAKPEYESIVNGNYGYYENEIILSGFPRYDNLYNNPKRIITFAPTWRSNLLSGFDIKTSNLKLNADFKKSKYYTEITSLLNSRTLLKSAKKYNYEIQFLPHPILFPYIDQFDINKNIKIFSYKNSSYQKMFAETDLMITDYSSTVFDFSYLKKPILYYQFDKNDGGYNYNTGYFDFERDGFGEVCYDQQTIMKTIIKYMKNNCELKPKYEERINKFFAFNDKNNCKRVYDAIAKLEQPDSIKVKKNFKYYIKQFFKIKKQYGLKVAIKWTKAHFKRIKQENSGK